MRTKQLPEMSANPQLFRLAKRFCWQAKGLSSTAALLSRTLLAQEHVPNSRLVPLPNERDSAGRWWAVAGLAVVLAQGLNTARAEEQASGPSTSQHSGPAYGNDSTAQWRLYTNIGNEHWRKGRKAEAERYLKRALQEARKGFGDGDGHVAAACNNLAELYRQTHDYEQAEPLYMEALRILEAAYGRKDVRYATAVHNIAGFYQTQRRYPLARQYYQLAPKALGEGLGQEHAAYARTLVAFADIARLTDDKPEAIALLQQALQIQDALGPPSAADASHTASRLGQVLVMNGQSEEGEALLRRCVEQVKALHEEGSPEYRAYLPMHFEVLAEALQKKGDLDGARQLLHKSIGLRSSKGANTSMITSLLLRTAEVELKIGQQDGNLRAHNLARQAFDRSMARWEALLAAKSRGEKSSSWWPGTAPEPSPDSARQNEVLRAVAVLVGGAGRVLAAAQERLDRLEDAKRTLSESLQILGHPAAQLAHMPGALHLGQGDIPRALEQELRRLQVVVDVLYSLLRLNQADEASLQSSSIPEHLSTLRERFPGLASEPPFQHQGITPLGGQVWKARKHLNDLQNEINQRKRHGL